MTLNIIYFVGFLEVMKGLWAKKQAKLKNNQQQESAEKPERAKEKHGSGQEGEARRSELEKDNQVSSIT